MVKYQLSVTVDEISIGHFLPDYAGACRRPHGHNWTFTVRIESNRLINDMVVDFTDIKGFFKKLDHTMLNDQPYFSGAIAPTTERLAEWLARELQRHLDKQPNRPKLCELTVVETSRNSVTVVP